MQEARVSPDISGLLQDLYDVVDTAIGTEVPLIHDAPARYDISSIDFSRLRAEFQKTAFKNVMAANLMEKIEQRLNAMLAANPTRVDLYERYQKIVQEYNNDKDSAVIQKVMDDLFNFNDDCTTEEKRYLREGLENEAELAVFDLLQKDVLSKQERETIKKVASDLLTKLKDQRFALDRLRSMATVQAQMKAEIIKHLFANLPPSAYAPDEISAKAGEVFAHLFTAGVDGSGTVYH
jgi:type I restriction enzyme R subunit